VIIGEYRYTDPTGFAKFADSGFDATFAYCWNPSTPFYGDQAVDYQLGMISGQINNGKIPALATFGEGWDPTPWIQSIDYIWAQTPYKLSPAEYQTVMEKGKAMIDQFPEGSLTRKVVMIDSWNEFGEGHWVAPTRGHGFEYLEAIRKVFAPDSSPPMEVLPRDVGLSPDVYEGDYKAWKAGMETTLGK